MTLTPLDWVSPLPPAKTDIAAYTMRVERALTGAVNLNLIANEDATEASRYRHPEFPAFYNMGNDIEFHRGILNAVEKRGGILIAHDHNIQEALIGYFSAFGTAWTASYLGKMHMAYGEAGSRAAEQYLRGKLTKAELGETFPGLAIAAMNADVIITHNEQLVEQIAEETGKFVFKLPLPVETPEEPIFPAKSGTGFRLLIFGYIGGNRHLNELLDIVGNHDRIELDIAGIVSNPETLRAVEEIAGISNKVRFHGFVTDAALDEMIAEADLVANLRSPSVGEVSSSQIRIMANAGVSIVYDDQWYRTLPDEAVFKIKPGEFVPSFMEIVNAIRESPDRCHAMRRAAHEFVRDNHAFEVFRYRFVDMLEQLEPAIRHGQKMNIARRLISGYHRAGIADCADLAQIDRQTGRIFDTPLSPRSQSEQGRDRDI